MQGDFSITNKTKMRIPRLSFLLLKNDILGKDYSLSIAYVTEKESQVANSTYRQKDTPTNVLSFSLSKKSGEILICPVVLKREIKEKKFDMIFPQLLRYLVIHGMLHLKGLKHGKVMEKEEKKYLSRTKF